MTHLLLLEMDGSDCIADNRHRLDAARASGFSLAGPGSSQYWKIVYDPVLIAQDTLVTGTRELIEFLVQRKWRVVLLTQRLRSRPVYAATMTWLEQYGFDQYWYELVLKENQYGRTSVTEWKALKVWMYGNESSYQRIVYVDPSRHCREVVQQQWSALSGCELEIYSGVTDFSKHLSLYALGASLRPILEQHETCDTDEEEDAQSTLNTDDVRDTPQKEVIPPSLQEHLVVQDTSMVTPSTEASLHWQPELEEPLHVFADDTPQSILSNDQLGADEDEQENRFDNTASDDAADTSDDLLDDEEEEMQLVVENVGRRKSRSAQHSGKQVQRVQTEDENELDEAESSKKKKRLKRDRSKERFLISIE